MEIKESLESSFISEENYKENMENTVEPFLNSIKKSGYLKGKDDIELYYEKFITVDSKGSIVISHGFGEYAEKYYELIFYFVKEGYSVFIIEHRGNSRSQRLGRDNCQINVKRFEDYIDDFKSFIDKIVIPETDDASKLFLFGHSMGGGIGTMFLEEYPEYFKRAVFSSPMYEINPGKYPNIVVKLLPRTMKLLGFGDRYLPGQHPYTGERRFPSRSTSSEVRYDYQYNKIKSNKLYQTGGTSANWYLQSLKATKNIVKPSNASKVKIPVLLLQSQYDTHVVPDGHYKFAQYAENCTIIKVKGAKHESYFECDNISFDVIKKIISFYNEVYV